MNAKITADIIVIGGSFTGLLVALASSVKGLKTIIVERGDLASGVHSRFVPQAEHIHLLLGLGERLIDAIAQGIFDDMRQEGALRVDQGHGIRCFDGHRWRQRFPTGVYATYFSRGLLQRHLLNRVHRQTLIQILEKSSVCQIEFDRGNGHTKGVRVNKECREIEIEAKLVIDASGRSSKLSKWLERIGVFVEQSHVRTDMGYVSQRFKRPANRPQWDALLALPRLPEVPRMAAICCIEDNQWQVTAGGWLGNYPERSATDLRRFLTELPVPEFVEALDTASPNSDVSRMCISGSRWRHFERCKGLPSGLLIVGDALCSMNPLYSQGMTIAALQISLISAELERLRLRKISTQELQRGLSALVEPAWEIARSEDSRLKEVAEKRNVSTRLHQWYLRKLSDAAATNRVCLSQLLSYNHLLSSGYSLYRPHLVFSVVEAMVDGWGHRRNSP